MVPSGTASVIHGVSPDLTWASCAPHSSVMHDPPSCVISHATAPSWVHGVCHVVIVIMSGQMIFRPAPHMQVNARHRSQYPSRAETGSRINKPQSGQVKPRSPAGTALPRRRRSIPRAPCTAGRRSLRHQGRTVRWARQSCYGTYSPASRGTDFPSR